MTEKSLTHEARIRALEREVLLSSNTISVSLEKHFESRLAALEKATTVAAATMDKRLDGMNEFRDTLKDQASRFVTRDELDVKLTSIADRVSENTAFKDRQEGKASQSSVLIAYGLAAIGIIFSLLNYLAK